MAEEVFDDKHQVGVKRERGSLKWLRANASLIVGLDSALISLLPSSAVVEDLSTGFCLGSSISSVGCVLLPNRRAPEWAYDL